MIKEKPVSTRSVHSKASPFLFAPKRSLVALRRKKKHCKDVARIGNRRNPFPLSFPTCMCVPLPVCSSDAGFHSTSCLWQAYRYKNAEATDRTRFGVFGWMMMKIDDEKFPDRRLHAFVGKMIIGHDKEESENGRKWPGIMRKCRTASRFSNPLLFSRRRRVVASVRGRACVRWLRCPLCWWVRRSRRPCQPRRPLPQPCRIL